MPVPFLRLMLAIGFFIDVGFGVLALFFQPLLPALLDLRVRDPALTTVTGGEFLVVALVYVAIFRAPRRFNALLWIVALDQFFAATLVAIEISRGHIPGTWKTIGPIPINLALCAIYLIALRGVRYPRPESYRHGD
jgi:hypothetical protein